MTLNEFQQHFLSLYDVPAQGIAAAPGRVNLIGEFTDYNDGLYSFSLSCSLIACSLFIVAWRSVLTPIFCAACSQSIRR